MTERQVTQFGELEIGDHFLWMGTEYVKTEVDRLPRYGWVNMRGPGFYIGDDGWRALDDDQEVEVLQ